VTSADTDSLDATAKKLNFIESWANDGAAADLEETRFLCALARSLESQLAGAERGERDALLERDQLTELLGKFAYTIGTIEEIGEHTSANDPWANAYERLQDLLAQLAESQRENAALREQLRQEREYSSDLLLDLADVSRERRP
jgi:hypothetical protein